MKIKKIITIFMFCIVFNASIIYAQENDNITKFNVFYNEVQRRTSMGDQWAYWITYTIIEKCKIHNVDPYLAFSLIANESDFNFDSISNEGAISFTQIMPETAKSIGINPNDPEDNIEGGIIYLKQLLDEFAWAGDLQATYAIAAYNAGPNKIYEYGTIPPYNETYNLINKVANTYEKLLKTN